MGSDDKEKQERGSADRELYCKQLERLLLGAAAELGHTGNLAQVVAAIERGGAGGGGIDNDSAMLRRIGWQQGQHDDYDARRRPVYRLGQLRELAAAWELLSRHHQATALAHYVGTPRAPETLRAHFGEFAGVVLHRWLVRKAKGRDRDAASGSAKAQAELERVRKELQVLERELTTIIAAEPPMVPPQPPEPPYIPLVLSRRARAEARAPYWQARAVYRAAADEHFARLEGWLAGVEYRLAELRAEAKPLEAKQARLCAVLAALQTGGDPAADELELVEACGTGGEKKKRPDLLPGGERDLTKPADADVRALHRAWKAARRKVAMAWAEDEQPAEAAAG